MSNTVQQISMITNTKEHINTEVDYQGFVSISRYQAKPNQERLSVFSNSEPLTYTFYDSQKYNAIIGNEQEKF